ncbi:hypothetical protein BVC80_1701g9 [Macleaya cordata]|uniref:ZCF37 n=1 Tax=Macleaya cordata TaxID=56857 RepID=A0A200Q601_MACCD|nr:hypothetical protein BVC80_1701g9 [Macleaya cordata]
MLNHFICGSGNFRHEDQEKDDSWISSSSPKRSSSRRNICSCKKNRKKKNPFSNRGLDKYATVLADLEGKRQKIIDQMGTQEISLIRFCFSKSKGWVPIVIKFRNQNQYKPKHVGSKYEQVMQNLEPKLQDKSNKIELSSVPRETEPAKGILGSEGRTKKSLLDRSVNSSRCRVPYYWGMVIILILLCLAIYGRSFAIICNTILWYLMPKMKTKDMNSRISMKKNESFVKKMGINGFTSFKTVNVNRSSELS